MGGSQPLFHNGGYLCACVGRKRNRLAQSIDSALLELIGQEAVRKCPARARGKIEENPENVLFSRFPVGGAFAMESETLSALEVSTAEDISIYETCFPPLML